MKSLALIAAIVALSIPSLAVAGKGPPIVLESYEGERPADADDLLKPVLAELDGKGYVTGAKLGAAVTDKMSSGSITLTASQVVEAQKFVESGYQQFINGDYALAIQETERAIALYAQAPAQMAKESALRDNQFKALLVLARSSEVLQKGEDAFRYMAEVIRSFPDRHVSAAQFDPKVNALYRKVKDELTKQGKATLEVKIDDAEVVVFVNERFIGTGSQKVDDLFPGRYRVYVQKGNVTGRVREVEVGAGTQAVMSVQWAVDGLLETRGGFVGLEFPRGGGTHAEIDVAVKVARQLGAAGVVVVGIRNYEGRRAVIGYTINTETQGKSFGAIEVEPVDPGETKLRNLGRYLAGEKGVAGVATREPREITPLAGPSGPSRPFKALKYPTVIAGVAGMAVGGYLLAISGDVFDEGTDHGTRPDGYHDTLVPGIAAAGAGVALTALGVYMFVADRKAAHETELSVIPTGDGWGLALSGQF